MSRGQYTSPSPLGTPAGAAFLGELMATPERASTLSALLLTDSTDDAELAQEQLALAAIVVHMVDPKRPYPAADAVADALREDPDAGTLPEDALTAVNRLLNSPYAALWQGHPDGGINTRRKARSLVTRLHRAAG